MVHKCSFDTSDIVHKYYEHNSNPYYYSSLLIVQCRECLKYWKVCLEFDPINESNIWVPLGESYNGIEFTREELDKILNKGAHGDENSDSDSYERRAYPATD